MTAQIFRKCDVIPAGGGLTVKKRGTRTSLTFRKVLRGPCECAFPKYCDSRIAANNCGSDADVEAMAQTEIASLEVVKLEKCSHIQIYLRNHATYRLL